MLEELRNLASELGMTLFYFVGRSKTKTENVTYDNFSMQKHIGLMRNGEIYLKPIQPVQLLGKLRRAVAREVKTRTIEKA